MGAAPRYCGNNEPCTFKVPIGGNDQICSGNILNATTTCKSGCHCFNASKKSGDFNFSGCKIGKLWARANCLTALCCSCMPLPAGLSGAVTTPTTFIFACNNALKEATAKAGVPIKTILGLLSMGQS